LFKNPIIDFINQEISAERERSIAIVSAPETDKITIHAPPLNISHDLWGDILGVSEVLRKNKKGVCYHPSW
jgi:hypothetical protein